MRKPRTVRCRTHEHGAVFPAQQPTHFDSYDDNGVTYAYRHGQYFLQRIGTERRAGVVQLTLGVVHGRCIPARCRSLFVLHRRFGPVTSVELPVEHRAQIRVVPQMR